MVILELMKKITGEEPAMWGDSIVGFGSYHSTYASGREGDWMITGFSPRKQSLTLYIMPGFEKYADLMGKLGKYRSAARSISAPEKRYVNEQGELSLSH